MPGAGMGIALALGLGILGAGLGAKKGSAAAPTAGPALDLGMPPEVNAKVRDLLANSTQPDQLDQVATLLEAKGYRNSAAALRARAAQLRGLLAVPGVPLPGGIPWPGGTSFPLPGAIPGVPPVVGPLPGTTPGAPQVPTIPGPMPPPPAPPKIEDLDPNIPPALAQAVASILAKPDLTDQELVFAEQLANTCEQSGYVRAAAKLRARTLAVRAMHAASSLLNQITSVLTAPPGTLSPLPENVPGLPPIVPAPAPPAPPTPVPVQPPRPTPPGAPPAVAPLARTYKVIAGDNPSRIALRFTGSGSPTHVRELAAANPDKSARILAGRIFVGETLTLPDAWPATPQFSAPKPAPAPAPLSALHATIQQGSTGPDVVLWQKIVGTTPDGVFGPKTDVATRAWQAAHGLTADGIVGPLTWAAALASAVPAAASPPFVPAAVPSIVPVVAPASTSHATIRRGSTGPDVVAWQQIIGVTADGQFGPQTEAATKAWQQSHGLNPDGIVGPLTWAAALTATQAAGAPLYQVQPGDSPFKIARRFTGDGSRVHELAQVNPDKAMRILQALIYPGETLTLPATWPAIPIHGASPFGWDPHTTAGVMEIIGATHHHGHHHRGHRAHGHHG